MRTVASPAWASRVLVYFGDGSRAGMWLTEDDWHAEHDGARFMDRTAADSTLLSYEHNEEHKQHPDHADAWGNVLTQTEPQREEPVRHAPPSLACCPAHRLWPGDQWQCAVLSCPCSRSAVMA